MVKIGLCGVGHLGSSHLRCLLDTPFTVIGVHDTDKDKGHKIAMEYNVPFFANVLDLIHAADAIDIVTPTTSHYELAQLCLGLKKHLFIEKPVTQFLNEALRLEELSSSLDVMIQVGHIERYNPALQSIEQYIQQPKFIETHRLAPMHWRGNDVSVVKDVMIHDLDLLLHWLPFPIHSVSANGVCLLNDTPDIANARIEFENGAVCNITASRVSMKKMRKSRIFQEKGYVSIDFLEAECQYIQFSKNPEDEFKIIAPDVPQGNALLEELRDFYRSIADNVEPMSNLASAVKSLRLAEQIEDIILNKKD